MGGGGSHRSGVLLLSGNNTWHRDDLFCSYSRSQWNVCQFTYSASGGSERYGGSFSEYAFLLVLFCCECYHALFALCQFRCSEHRLANVSSVECFTRS